MFANLTLARVAVPIVVALLARYLFGLGWTWALIIGAATFFGWIVFGGCPKTNGATAPAAA